MKHTNLIVWTALMASVCGASIEAASFAADIDEDDSEAASSAVSVTVAATAAAVSASAAASVNEGSLSVSHAVFLMGGAKRRKVGPEADEAVESGKAAVASVSAGHKSARLAAQREGASPTHAAREAAIFNHVLDSVALADGAVSAELAGLLGGVSVGRIARGAAAPAAGAGAAEFRPLPVISFRK